MYDKRDESRIGSGNDTYHAVLVSRGRSGQDDSYTESLDDTKFGEINNTEIVEIIGEYRNETILNKNPVKLVIQGNDNTITIDKRTIVSSISIYGRRNILNIPNNSSAQVQNSGIECEVHYF